MDIPVEEEERVLIKGVPTKRQMDPGPMPEMRQHSMRGKADDGELWVVSKALLARDEFPLVRVKGGKVNMGAGWVRTDGDEVDGIPTHIYVVANRQ